MRSTTKNMALAALFLAVGFFLPYITGQIQAIGQALLPMHIPVILCGLVCGWKWGLLVGFILPFLRSILTGMPAIFPMAVAMSLELATYGFVSGWFWQHSRWKCIPSVYKALCLAMIAGRIVYGIAMAILMAATGQPYSFGIFFTSAVISGIPGIIVQLILIPLVMAALNRAGVVTFSSRLRKA